MVSIAPYCNLESNYKVLFELALNNPELKDSVYSTSDLNRLRTIAHLCPFMDGSAVYTARVILYAFEPDSTYYNYCEFAKKPDRESSERFAQEQENIKQKNNSNKKSNYLLIPNPNTGSFYLTCPDNELLSCTITDYSGRVIESGTYKPEGNKINFSLNSISKGVYNLKVTSFNEVRTFKIVLHY